jgi:ABC-type transport system substrate-binding protein
MVTGGDLAFGSYTEIDELFRQQAGELAPAKRESLLHAIQRIAYERVMFAPIWQVAQLNGVRTRIHQPSIGLIDYLPYSSPYEDLRMKP